MMVGKSGGRRGRITDYPDRSTPVSPPPTKQNGGSRAAVAPGERAPSAERRPTAVPIGVVEDIKKMLQDLVGAVTQLTARVDAASEGAEALKQRLTVAETRISDLEDLVTPLKKKVEALEQQVRGAQTRLEDQEGRSRRANIRILGVPEGMEGSRPAEFVEQLVKDALPRAQLSVLFLVERAHRSLQPRPPPGAPPRPMVAKILNFRDRDAVLAAARVAEVVKYKTHRLSFYPDYTLHVQGLRKQFNATKAALRIRNIKYSIMHPAKIRFIHANKTHFYTDPKAAMEYIERSIPLTRNDRGSRGGSQRNSPEQATPLGKRKNEILAVLEMVAQKTGGRSPGSDRMSSGSTTSSLDLLQLAGSGKSTTAGPSGEIRQGGLNDWIMSTPPPVSNSEIEDSLLGDND